jgi:hypothetical protein
VIPPPPVVTGPSVPSSPSLSHAQGIDRGIELYFSEIPTSLTGAPAATGFEYRLDGGAWSTLTWSPQTVGMRGTISGLTNGQKYTVQIRAIAGASGELHSLQSSTATATPRYLVPAPQDLKVTVLPGAIKVTWAAPTGAVGLTGYEVRAFAEDVDGWVSCATGLADLDCVLPVAAGKKYGVEVMGVGADGLGIAVYDESGVVPAVEKPVDVPTKDDGDIRTANGPIDRATAGEKITLIGSGFLPRLDDRTDRVLDADLARARSPQARTGRSPPR